jgi:hypothetical protein
LYQYHSPYRMAGTKKECRRFSPLLKCRQGTGWLGRKRSAEDFPLCSNADKEQDGWDEKGVQKIFPFAQMQTRNTTMVVNKSRYTDNNWATIEDAGNYHTVRNPTKRKPDMATGRYDEAGLTPFNEIDDLWHVTERNGAPTRINDELALRLASDVDSIPEWERGDYGIIQPSLCLFVDCWMQ